MAKGLRATTRKRNNANLRAKFAPLYDARTKRLSAKLQELAAQPRPTEERIMDVDDVEKEGSTTAIEGRDVEDVDVEMQGTNKTNPAAAVPNKKRGPTRIEKKIATRKARNSITFAPNERQKRRQAKGKKS